MLQIPIRIRYVTVLTVNIHFRIPQENWHNYPAWLLLYIHEIIAPVIALSAKFAKKVHKPPPRVNVINFELNGFNASILLGVPQTQKSCDALIGVFKFIRYL